jgi:type I restriction enzyme M protein
MNKNNEPAPIVWKMLNLCRNTGISSSDGAILVGQMLAWASLSPTKLEPELNFFSYNTELTTEGWESVTNQLREKSDRYALAFTPIDNLKKKVSPGLLEKLKSLAASIDCQGQQDKATLQEILTNQVATPMKLEFIAEEVEDLIVELIAPTPSSSIYCPFSGSAQLALTLSGGGSKSVSFECQEQTVCQIVALLAILGSNANPKVQGSDRIDISCSDPILNPRWISQGKLTQFNCSVSVPPLGRRYQEEIFDPYQRFPPECLAGEVLHLAHILAQTKERAAILVANGFLFNTTRTKRSFKEQLLRQGCLQAVIGLPGGILAPYSIATAILLFDKTAAGKGEDQRHQRVVFIDATTENFLQPSTTRRIKLSLKPEATREIAALVRDRQDGPHSRVATIDQIAQQDFNLAVDRYVLSAEDKFVRQLLKVHKTIELEAIAEIHRPQVISDGGKEPFYSFKEVALSDIQASGLIVTPSKIVEVSTQNLGGVRKHQIEGGDVLVCVKGRVGTVGLVMPKGENSSEQECWIAGQSLAIVRLRDSSPIKHPFVLFRYLTSPLGQRLLQFFSQGLTVPQMQMGELRKLPILVPSEDEQQKIVRDRQTTLELHQKIADTERQIAEIDSTSWPMSLAESALKS